VRLRERRAGRRLGGVHRRRPDEIEPTSFVIMCPVCAAREFEWRPEAAEGYV